MLDNRNVLRTLLWDPLEPTATRPLPLAQDASLYCYGMVFNKNVTEVFDGDGRIAAAYDYSPYGQAASTGDLVQPVQWSGEMHDDDLALVYYNYRYYNPKDGRWINRDPIAEQGGWNLYAFLGNSTQNQVDRLGLESYEKIKVPFKGKEKCCKDILTFENLQKSTRFGLYVKKTYWGWIPFPEYHVSYSILNRGDKLPVTKSIGDIIFWAFWKETPPLTYEDMQSVKKCYELSGRRDIIMTYRVKRKDGWKEEHPRLGENQLPLLGFGDSRLTLNGITNRAPDQFYTSSRNSYGLRFIVTIYRHPVYDETFEI